MSETAEILILLNWYFTGTCKRSDVQKTRVHYGALDRRTGFWGPPESLSEDGVGDGVRTCGAFDTAGAEEYAVSLDPKTDAKTEETVLLCCCCCCFWDEEDEVRPPEAVTTAAVGAAAAPAV